MPPQERPRRRTHPILRVRTGCFSCRTRKKKCDERKPVCAGCTRNYLACTWPLTKDPKERHPQRVREVSRPACSDGEAAVNDRVMEELSSPSDASPPGNLSNSQRSPPSSSESPPGLLSFLGDFQGVIGPVAGPLSPHDALPTVVEVAEDNNNSEEISTDVGQQTTSELIRPGHMRSINASQRCADLSVPLTLSLFPSHGHEPSELLGYYLSKTANSMGNGSTDINPFIVQLVPLAFSSELILQLILTQSAAHRAAIGDESADKIALSYYSKSLRLFRESVNNYTKHNAPAALTLGIGALIMCFTETAKGDIHGAIFDHLAAANTILIDILCKRNSFISKDLGEFLVEYYTYTATLSMISIDARFSTEQLLSPELEQLANGLVASKYVGSLCGCWLELILLVPQIFELGRRALAVRHENDAAFPSADDILMFSSLHAQILSFSPDPFLSMEVSLAGYVYQQAVLLYLLTVLGSLCPITNGCYDKAIQKALSDALSFLTQLPLTCRINTSLCWPLAVIGSCLVDESMQDILRGRLQAMVQTIGLGNMKQTLTLLEHMWELPSNKCNPWAICRIMQENELWISFA